MVSDGATLAIDTGGDFTMTETGCKLAGNISSLDAFSQSDCLPGVATCGIVHLSPGPNTDCAGYTAGTPAPCSYWTSGNSVTVNCGTGDQTFQWQ